VRVGHLVVVAVVGGLVLGMGEPMRVALAQPIAGVLEVYDVVPAELHLRMAVGEQRQFSIWARGDALQYQWLIDGSAVGDRHAWTFVPRPTEVGSHLVTVVVDGPEGRVSHSWHVQVEPGTPAPPPTLAEPLPSVPPPTQAPVVTTTAPPTTSSTLVTTTSTTEEPTTSTRPPTTTSTRAPTTTSTRTTTTSTHRPTTSTTARPTTSTAPAPAPVPTTTIPPRTSGITQADVQALFERFKSAWHDHDIEALESVGQVATQGQADALKSYFESVRELSVDVDILEVTLGGDEARVKFIRRDHFRDPGGSMVTKESPVIEKRIVRTPGGLRLAPLQ